jgi:glycosyltransferase involved in cell wall biosynthesis
MTSAQIEKNKKVVAHTPRPFYVIGICTRNRRDNLQRLINSISDLRFPDGIRLAIAIVDNNDTLQVLATDFDLPESIDLVIHHEPRPGLVYARNALFEVVEDMGGDWLLGIDDDEWLDSEWLAEWHRGTNKWSAGILVGTATLIFREGLHPLHPKEQFPLPTEGKLPRVYTTANYAIHKSVFDRKSGLGLRFDPTFDKSGGEDTELMLRAMRQHGIRVLGWPFSKAYEMRGADRDTFKYEIWRGIRNQVNFYCTAKKHYELGIVSIWNGPTFTILKSMNRNLVFGVGLTFLACGKLVLLREDAGATLGRALRRFARLGAIVPYRMGTMNHEYGR